MTPPYRAVALAAILVVTGFAAGAANAAPCSLIVDIAFPNGRPASLNTVELEGPDGKIVATAKLENGDAKFCDFGFGKHTVVIDRGKCAEMRVGNLEADFSRTQRLRVILSRCPTPHIYGGVLRTANGESLGPACQMSLRVSDPEGAPVEGARLADESGAILQEADQFGRILHIMLAGNELKGAVAAPGFEPHTLDLMCNGTRQLTVTLHPSSN